MLVLSGFTKNSILMFNIYFAYHRQQYERFLTISAYSVPLKTFLKHCSFSLNFSDCGSQLFCALCIYECLRASFVKIRSSLFILLWQDTYLPESIGTEPSQSCEHGAGNRWDPERTNQQRPVILTKCYLLI